MEWLRQARRIGARLSPGGGTLPLSPFDQDCDEAMVVTPIADAVKAELNGPSRECGPPE